MFYADYDLEFIPALESECARRNIAMEIVRFVLEGSGIVFRDAAVKCDLSSGSFSDVAGYVVINDGSFRADRSELFTG